MRRFTAIVTACLATGLSASAASAGFTANYLGYGNFQSHSVGYSTALAWNSVASVSMFNLKLAEHRWEVGGESVYTWCAQLYQGVTAGNSYAYEAVALEMAPQTPPAPGPMGVAKATLLRDAMSRWLGSDGRVIESAGSADARECSEECCGRTERLEGLCTKRRKPTGGHPWAWSGSQSAGAATRPDGRCRPGPPGRRPPSSSPGPRS